MPGRSTRAALVFLALALTATACGSSASKTAATGPGTSVGAAPTTAGQPTPGSAGGATATKPVVNVPSGPPPTTLQIKDLIVGSGAEAAAGQNVSVQYVGVAYSTKQQFDASWDRGQAFPFTLGAGQVIKGWDQGVVGMKVGGRRQLIIPPDLAYGAQGYPPTIKGNETLVFVIDLVSVG
jgi:peptidylprolyl isomerase